MDPTQVIRGDDGIFRCRQCGFSYDLDRVETAQRAADDFETFRTVVLESPEEIRGWRPAPEIWSINAYTAHMAEAANIIYERVRNIAEQDRPVLEYYDEQEAVERGHYDDRPAVESLEPLRESVEAFRRCLESLAPDDWDRVGIHSRAGEVRLSEIAQDMPHELEHHAEDITRIARERVS
ncbi:MAG TPA: DinB family protein [Chloroflexota bacterium]